MKESKVQLKPARRELSVVAVEPAFLRNKDASAFLGSEQVLRDCETGGWIKPAHRRHKLTLFRLTHLRECVERISAGEYPER